MDTLISNENAGTLLNTNNCDFRDTAVWKKNNEGENYIRPATVY